MQLRIKSFNTHKTALTIAWVFFILILFTLLPIMLMMSSHVTVQQGEVNQIPVVIIISLILSFMYSIFSYLGVRLGGWLYNQIAKKTGGIVINVENLVMDDKPENVNANEFAEKDLAKREN